MFTKYHSYQNIEIPGEETIADNPNRKNSKFWNEGKWDNFIAPLLPKEDRSDQSFTEIGCNAGLFLKMAKEVGFRDVLGVESDKLAYEKGVRYRDSLKLDYKLLNRTVGEDFSWDEMPLSDVVLLSNVHYYFKINDWLNFVDRMKHKTRYCLVISRPVDPTVNWYKPLAGIKDVRLYFKDWEEVGAIYNVRSKGDPSPRELWAFLFKSKLQRTPFKDFRNIRIGDMVKEGREELIKKVIGNEVLDIKETNYYQSLRKRLKRWTEERTYNFVKNKINMLFDIKNNGLKDPVIIQLDNTRLDGGHRMDFLAALNYKSVITRIV
jgi:hypothetical protein